MMSDAQGFVGAHQLTELRIRTVGRDAEMRRKPGAGRNRKKKKELS